MNVAALAVLIISNSIALLLVPDIGVADLIEPTILASISIPIVLACIVGLRFEKVQPVWERRLLAVFLVAMPIVYLSSLALHGGGASWLAIEAAGMALFTLLAIAGLRRSGVALALGLAAHGLCWDVWHLGRTPFIPDWYAMGCLMVDVGIGLYALSRVSAWGPLPRPVAS